MKTQINILLGTALFTSALTLSACTEAAGGAAPSATPTVTASEAKSLQNPEPGAVPAQYQARLVTLRLLGTQGEGSEASATLADTATWYTRTYRIGETIGRNLKLAAVSESELVLTDGTAPARTVRPGQDIQVRVIEHEFDTAAVEHGDHQWTVKAASMSRLLSRYGVGATATTTEFAGQTAIKLGPVQPGSVLARLGLQRGDLVFELGGQPATLTTLEHLAHQASQNQSQVLTLKMARGASLWERAYVIE